MLIWTMASCLQSNVFENYKILLTFRTKIHGGAHAALTAMLFIMLLVN